VFDWKCERTGCRVGVIEAGVEGTEVDCAGEQWWIACSKVPINEWASRLRSKKRGLVSICLWWVMKSLRFADPYGLQMMCLTGMLRRVFLQLRYAA
jgi:hypothetical protein